MALYQNEISDIMSAMLEYHLMMADLNECIDNKNIAVRNQDYKQAAVFREQENTLRKKMSEVSERLRKFGEWYGIVQPKNYKDENQTQS